MISNFHISKINNILFSFIALNKAKFTRMQMLCATFVVPKCVYSMCPILLCSTFVSVGQSQQTFDNQFHRTFSNRSFKHGYALSVQTSCNDDQQTSSTVPGNKHPPLAPGLDVCSICTKSDI